MIAAWADDEAEDGTTNQCLSWGQAMSGLIAPLGQENCSSILGEAAIANAVETFWLSFLPPEALFSLP